jgi:glycosyltransferase involved in cell wall biosynthesis
MTASQELTALERSSPLATSSSSHPQKAVIVHGGARDSYQLALALQEAGTLETLVTDLFWPSDRSWAKKLETSLSGGLRELITRRTAPLLPSRKVSQCVLTGLRGLLLDRLPQVPFSIRRTSNRIADAKLGRVAGARARKAGAGLVTYSYFGYDAMRAYKRPAMLFQVHPHPATVRRLLRAELAAHPDCAASLMQEWELALPEEDYQRLIREPGMAHCLLAASTFSRDSLIENGIPSENITVVPYGVDLIRFHPAHEASTARRGAPLQLLFVGRINQRKGIKYLLEALRMFPSHQVQLTICGRVVDDLQIFRPFADQITIRPSVSVESLVAAYQAADLFVFPSVVEGFGQVLLESLACGLPILSTTHTAAPDLIEDGVQGFIVEPRRPELLAERIQWALDHPADLGRMRTDARNRAEAFTWTRFRTQAAAAVQHYLDNDARSST